MKKSWNHFLPLLSNWQHQYHSLVWAHSPGSSSGNGMQAAGLYQGSVQAKAGGAVCRAPPHHTGKHCLQLCHTPLSQPQQARGAAAGQWAQQGYITPKYSKEIIQLSYFVQVLNCSYHINSSTQQIKPEYILCSDSRLALMADWLQVQWVFLLWPLLHL